MSCRIPLGALLFPVADWEVVATEDTGIHRGNKPELRVPEPAG